ncbi:PAS domain-containing protein [Magnetovibrio sp. PR-2]|uniref:PAS domain-containing protein n=1 Tax=Magnetovibrio sp. PR-2 TaxID=3120356 RepID=UPI002FCDEFAB
MTLESKTHLHHVANLIKGKGITAEKLSDDPAIGVAIHFQTEFLDCNARFCEITQYARDEVIGAKAWIFVPPESIEKILKQLNMLSETPYEVTALKKSGAPMQVEITGRNFDLGKGQAARAIFVRELCA